ncbi:GNAT family N-acetyltransferase [Actinacidiphila oryziradicis]|uniref:GNAT family N-acetyltransferase n=1 Tax=Actinacidiphila oryziradicis TaxID=2571141 RepID=A0A4U0RS75_9ACTN|nr:GNAT family N-acetyltransferase [Actinacidiphila oryziradicis]TJZ98266.1 GNAT family N-acetyltransferase [Actinacidiphila oryziradicis]
MQTPNVTSPTPVDIRLVRPQDTELLDAVVELGDRFNKRLGFLPPAAYKQKAGQGTLLAATIGGRLAGYTLFGLPGQRVRLTHLCVDGEFQGPGHRQATGGGDIRLSRGPSGHRAEVPQGL